MGSSSPRSLADHLRALDDAVLAAFLRARPDLANPVPADFSVLATRAQARLSIARALEGLDAFTLSVLDAVRLTAAPTTTRSRITAFTGVPAETDAALDALIALAVVWGDDEVLHVVPMVAD